MHGSAVVSVLVLVSSINVAIAAVTATPSTVKSSRSSSVARSATNNVTEKVITFRQSFGNTEEQCRCVVFHLCENNDVVDARTADNQEQCTDENVCCRINSSLLSPTGTDPSPIESTSPSRAPDCFCVPFWECENYHVVSATPSNEENIENIMQPKISSVCEPPNFCCSKPGGMGSTTVVTPAEIIPTSSLVTTNTPLPTSSESSIASISTTPNVEQECGIRGTSDTEIDFLLDISKKIVGGVENEEMIFGEFPWMIALFHTNNISTNGVFICGASLLTPSIVLTAAHCVHNIDMTLLRVRAGEFNIDSDINETLPHQDRTVISVHIHPNYNPKRLYNDLALLSVNEPFHYDSHVNSICAPFVGSPYVASNPYNPKSCWAAGWGKSNFTDELEPRKLKKVQLPIVKRDECQTKLRTMTKLGGKYSLDSSFLCAGGQPGYDSCKGDGGGPLFCASRSNINKFIQVGVVSWGIGCGNEVPGIYASLEANSEWLTAEVNVMTVYRSF